MTRDQIVSKRPYLIAEVGSNWYNMSDCLASVQNASHAGANAVKFQLYDWACMYGVGEPDEKFLRTCLPKEWLPILKQEAEKSGIEFMCTPFSPDYARYVDRFVNIHKVASSDLNYMELIEEIIGFNKPVLVSCGGHSNYEIDQTVDLFKASGKLDNLILMHCVSNYPARDANLGRIKALQDRYKVPVGFSDHTLDITTIPVVAAHNCSAVVIEKHYKTRLKMESPDSPHSISTIELGILRERLDDPTKFNDGSLTEEGDMGAMHNRRIVAIKDIKKGEMLEKDVNYGSYRVGQPAWACFSSYFSDQLHGAKAKEDIKAGSGVPVTAAEPLYIPDARAQSSDRKAESQPTEEKSKAILQDGGSEHDEPAGGAGAHIEVSSGNA